jgi:hypothetical protein
VGACYRLLWLVLLLHMPGCRLLMCWGGTPTGGTPVMTSQAPSDSVNRAVRARHLGASTRGWSMQGQRHTAGHRLVSCSADALVCWGLQTLAWVKPAAAVR